MIAEYVTVLILDLVIYSQHLHVINSQSVLFDISDDKRVQDNSCNYLFTMRT